MELGDQEVSTSLKSSVKHQHGCRSHQRLNVVCGDLESRGVGKVDESIQSIRVNVPYLNVVLPAFYHATEQHAPEVTARRGQHDLVGFYFPPLHGQSNVTEVALCSQLVHLLINRHGGVLVVKEQGVALFSFTFY